MANVIHLHCHRCGEPLANRDGAYCPPCNLYLAYKAMPFLLGMLLLGHPATGLVDRNPHTSGRDTSAGEDEAALDLAAMNWE
jgi:hypothetical protein